MKHQTAWFFCFLILMIGCRARVEPPTPIPTTALPVQTLSPTVTPTRAISQTSSPWPMPPAPAPVPGFSEYPAADLLRGHITSIAQAQDGTMWFRGGDGVAHFDGVNWKIYTKKDDLRVETISALALDPNGDVWLGTEAEGILRFSGKEWIHYTSEDGLAGNEITALAVSTDGILWVATRAGISQYDGSRWSSYHFIDIEEKDYIRRIVFTSDGVVWFGLAQGRLVSFDGGSWKSQVVGGSLIDMSAAPDGTIWIIRDRGVIHIVGDTITAYDNSAFQEHAPARLAISKDGVVWVGNWAGGYQLARFNGKSWVTIEGDEIIGYDPSRNRNELPLVFLYTIFVDRDNALWFGTGWSCYRYIPAP